MATEQVPLGAPELGMTRGEMLEHIDFLWSYLQVQEDFTVQIVFAWLVAMVFVARRLTQWQFLAAHFFYGLLLLRQYMSMYDSSLALADWYHRAGISGLGAVEENGAIVTVYFEYIAGFVDQSMMFFVLVGSIWWSISCRRSGAMRLDIKDED